MALRSRARIARRAAVLADSRNVAPVQSPDASDDDRCSTIEEEIARLPESLRLPVVMCYVQGLTNSEAASRIGCPEGTVASRLARARNRLRRRLRARGIAFVGAAALVEALSSGTSAAVAPALEKATLAIVGQVASAATPGVLTVAAVRLGHEVARQMSWQRLVQYCGAVLVGTAIVGSFVVVRLGLWSTEREPDAVSAPGRGSTDTNWATNPQMIQMDRGMMPANPGPDLVRQKLNATLEALQGNWPLDEWQMAGESLPVSPEEQRIEFVGGRCLLVNITSKPGPVIAQAILDPTYPDHMIDFVIDPDDQPHRVLCVYELVDDTLRLSIGAPDGPRPGKLNSARGDRHHSYVFKRARARGASGAPPPE